MRYLSRAIFVPARDQERNEYMKTVKDLQEQKKQLL